MPLLISPQQTNFHYWLNQEVIIYNVMPILLLPSFVSWMALSTQIPWASHLPLPWVQLPSFLQLGSPAAWASYNSCWGWLHSISPFLACSCFQADRQCRPALFNAPILQQYQQLLMFSQAYWDVPMSLLAETTIVISVCHLVTCVLNVVRTIWKSRCMHACFGVDSISQSTLQSDKSLFKDMNFLSSCRKHTIHDTYDIPWYI